MKKPVYQWDKDKAASNIYKHGIDFADAVSVFSDDLSTTVNDEIGLRKSDSSRSGSMDLVEFL